MDSYTILHLLKVLVNDERVTPAYSNDDFTITSTGIDLLLKIPAINATVVFKGLLLTVDLPFSLFSGNTEGLCGKSLFLITRYKISHT